MLTKTAATKRLRAAAAAARAADWNLTKNMRVEVGLRSEPVYANSEAQARRMAWHVQRTDDILIMKDDLQECLPLVDAAKYDLEQVGREGYVAHLYFSTTGWNEELYDVVTVWTGTDTLPPVVL